MKNFKLFIALIFLSNSIIAQVSGNINYQHQTKYADSNINMGLGKNADLVLSVKGLANVKADNYVAIFNVSQVGKTTKEVNEMLNERIAEIMNAFSNKTDVETYVDMVSFVPVYEYEEEKKIFSKKTYNEVPAGFELKKNIHIKYKDPNFLNELISICTSVEVYDLVRVDYISSELEQIKADLMKKSRIILTEKIANYQEILGVDLSTFEKQVVDGYKMVYPIEMYKSYNAYTNSFLSLKKAVNINIVNKDVTLYYQPIIDKEFDFVVNPTILEPVIQVMYEIKFKVCREKDTKTKMAKEYIFISPNGDLKPVNLSH